MSIIEKLFFWASFSKSIWEERYHGINAQEEVPVYVSAFMQNF